MSDIKIQPSGSGTAVVTLTAPTTNTARTITFPDATGTLLNSGSTLDATKLSGALPALSATNLTAIPAANITGTHANFLSTGVDDNATAVKLTVTDSGININGDITFSSASQGICLGVTSNTDANTLDDYEEGTWTATMLCTSGTITLHSAIRTLAYVKIGKVVTITGNLYASAVSSPSGALTITGLPFTNGPGNHSRTAISVRWEELNTTAATSLQGNIMEGATVIQLSRFAAGVMTTMAGDIKVGSHVRIGGSYIAAT